MYLKYVGKLLNCVRTGLLSQSDLFNHIKSHPYIKDNNECKDYINKTLNYFNNVNNIDTVVCIKYKNIVVTFFYFIFFFILFTKNINVDYPMCKPRIPHEILFVFGGWSGGPTNEIEIYDVRADRWNSIENPDICKPPTFI